MSTPTRTDTTLVGPVDNQDCWIFASTSYPPPNPPVLFLMIVVTSSSANTTSISEQFVVASTDDTPAGIVPLCVRTSFSSASSEGVVTLTAKCYDAPGGNYLGNITGTNWTLTDDMNATMDLTPQIPSTYPIQSVMSSVPYLYPVNSGNLYLFFIPGLTRNSQGTIPVEDLNWLGTYRDAQPGQAYLYSSQMRSFLDIVFNGDVDPTQNGFTNDLTYTRIRQYGMVFYSNGSCGDPVSFTGIDGSTQTATSSYGPCTSGTCGVTDGQFSCPTQTQSGSNMSVNLLVLGVIVVVVIIIIIALVVGSSSKDKD